MSLVTEQTSTIPRNLEVLPRSLRGYKSSPDLSNSRWYKGMLLSRMVRATDSNGELDFAILRLRPGTEPPPHVHSREDELFYVLSGEMKAYVGGEVLNVTAGECVFLPRQIPHAWLITSDEAHMICVITPAGFTDALTRMSFPAERMEVPTDPDMLTYATADLTETIEVFAQYGIRLLMPDEIRVEMPEFPL